jgi:hypothetical protein
MRPLKTTAGSVCLWLSRLLSGLWVCFNFVEASERLSRTGTARRKRTTGVRGLEWEEYVACWLGFPPAGYTSIRITATLGYE